jgi:iron complex outermembrane receptor protein
MAYELGYRFQTKRRFSVDLAAFHNVYTHLQTYEPGTPFFEPDPQPSHLVLPSYSANKKHGQSNGVELSSNWNIIERWRVISGYSSLWLDIRLDPDSHAQSPGLERVSPRHQFQVRSNLDVSRKLQFDTSLYYVSALPALPVDAYARLDARLGYRFRPDAEFSLFGQNLQGGRHVEYLSVGPYTKATIGRSFMAKFTWSF